MLLVTELAGDVHATRVLELKLIGHALNIKVMRTLRLLVAVAFQDALATQLEGFILTQCVELGTSYARAIRRRVREGNHLSQVDTTLLGSAGRLRISPLDPLGEAEA